MYTRQLRDIRSHHVAIAGGKGANLGELIRAGFPVPDGFVVTAEAYDRFVAQNGLDAVIARALSQARLDGAAIREAFKRGTVPAEIREAVFSAYEGMGRGAVAVRSSATAEDLPGAAFAGQHDSFLNIIGAEALLEAIRLCWASLWNDRAIVYRARQEIDHQRVKLAAIVQRQVAADIAGVMFTANPVTGERRETVIDASPGLGEAVVSGVVTPDRFILRRRGWMWRIAEKRPGRREIIIKASPGGGTERSAGTKADERLSLRDSAARSLARYGAAIERLFGSPQDIEWAAAAGRIYIVQSRPMTALPPVQLGGRMLRAVAGFFAEMFPVRPYPLDATTWVPTIYASAVKPVVGLLGLSVPPFEAVFLEEDGVLIRFGGKFPIRPTPATLIAPARLAWMALRYNPLRWREDPVMARAKARVADLRKRDLAPATWEGLLDTVNTALSLPLPLVGLVRRRYFPRTGIAALCLWTELAILRRAESFWPLLSGVESMTLEANRSLEAMGESVRADSKLAGIFASHEPGHLMAALENEPSARLFLADLRGFLERYGHRETVFSSVLQPTWRDAPEVVLGIIKGFASTSPSTGAAAPHRVEGLPRWEQARDSLLEHPLLRMPPFRWWTLRLLVIARCLWSIREDTHFNATLIMPVLRKIFLEMGRRLQGAGVADAREDIFHLKLDELEKMRPSAEGPPSAEVAAGLHAKILRRRKLRAGLENTPLIDLRLFPVERTEGAVLVRGSAGSAGVAVGPVRVIHDSSEFGSLLKGEVIVASYTNPSWTPLFQRAAAIVVDGGAAGSHAAIVAREYGIPAVMGTVEGTKKLVNGQLVRVDGTHGIVYAAG